MAFAPPGGWTVYDSYTTDPYYRKLLLAGFAGLLGATTLITLPDIVRHARIRGRSALKHGTVFFTETWGQDEFSSDNEKQYHGLYDSGSKSGGRWSAGRPLPPMKRALTRLQALAQRAYIWTPTINLSSSKHSRPRYLSLSTGPILLVILSACIILSTILPEQQLAYNANRLGFLALGLIPVIFLLAMKSFSPLVLVLGKSYEKLNFLHRWIGRMLLVILLAHASLWINSWQKTSGTYTLQMLSQSKQIYGITALSFLLLLAASSIRPARSFSYPTFFFLHIVGFVGFIVAVSYHTPYARSWTGYTVCGIYGLDLVGRICKWRIRSVSLEPLFDADGQSTGMTHIMVQDLNGGWLAGQHVQVRVFFSAASKTAAYGNWLRDTFHLKAFRSIESHPFTIAQAPPHISILPRHQSSHGFALYARTIGPEESQESWTADLNQYASARTAVNARITDLGVHSEYAETDGIINNEQAALMRPDSNSRAAECTAMLEGPYGGLGYQQLETQESLLLVACGSGMSFVLALLDDTIGRVIRGHQGARTKHIRVVWVVRHEAHLSWFEEILLELKDAAEASGILQVNLDFFVTCTSYDTASSPSCRCNTHTQQQEGPCCCTAPAATRSTKRSHRRQYQRPIMSGILNEALASAVNPCKTCMDCRCAEFSGDGTCGGAGGCGGCQMPREADIGINDIERASLPIQPREGPSTQIDSEQTKGGGCCGEKKPTKQSCCSGLSSLDSTSACCCASGGPTGQAVDQCACAGPLPTEKSQLSGCGCSSRVLAATKPAGLASLSTTETSYPPVISSNAPAEIRTGGLAVLGCGPRGMLAELGNAISGAETRLKVKIGGIRYHAEGYEL